MRDVTVGVDLSAPVSFNALGEDGPTTPGTGVSVIITGVTGEDDKISGRVTATIDVERGEFEKIALYVDGAEVDAQLFGLGPASAEDPPVAGAAQQGGVVFRLSFNSDEYDDETGAVTYPNDTYQIVAGVTLQGSTEESYSNRMEVEFENSSFVAASVSGLGEGARNSRTGRVWHGGPDVSVEISALAVSYSSGAAVSSVTLLSFCGDDAATDSKAPFSFPVDCDGFQSESDGTTPMFNVGGADIDSQGGKVYLDFKAPDAPHFGPDPNKREGGWVNASVGFTAEYKDEKGKRDGWLIYNDDSEDNDADDGVGEYIPQIRFAEAGDDKEVGGALDATAHRQVPPALAAMAGQSSKADAYCVVVSAVDMLGNESKLPDADDDCVSAEDYDVDSAGLLAGVDLQAPTIAFSPASPKANAATMRNFQLQLADEGSGIRENSPLKASVNLRDKDDDEELEDLVISVSLPLATTAGLPNGVGYYTFTASVTDKAGNVSDEATRTALDDTSSPDASTIVGDYDEKKGQFSMVATVTDNLSIKAYWSEARFGDGNLSLDAVDADGGAATAIVITQGLVLPQEGMTVVDGYNAAGLTQATLAPALTAKSYRVLQASDQPAAAELENINSLGVVAIDHGGQKSDAPSENTALAPTGLSFDLEASEIEANDEGVASVVDSDRETFTGFAAEVDQSGGDVEVTVKASGRFFVMPVVEVGEVTAEPTATPPVEAVEGVDPVTGSEGLRDNPLTRIDFYATTETFDIDGMDNDNGDDVVLKYIGSMDAATAGARDYDANIDNNAATTDNDSREYIYTMTISESALADMVGSKGEYTGHIVAFGVKDDKGAALSAPAVPVEIEK